ncbi:MAG: hypothetical protein J6T87_11755 [Bacteroidales bacterium]|nr:hypothetical protein [Bacteroidales bacterium]
MKKVLAIVSAVLMLAAITTSCNKKGCTCYYTTDITHVAPLFQNDEMTKDECKAQQEYYNNELGVNLVKCK